MDWRNLMKQSVTVGAQLLWGGCYGCNNGRYGCTIVMSYIEINKAVSQWLLTFNLCVSVTWPLTCAFHIPCTHTPEIIDMHRGVCDNVMKYVSGFIWKLGINFALFIKWIDETWWNNRLLLVPNCYEVVAMVATMVAMVAPLWCHTLR